MSKPNDNPLVRLDRPKVNYPLLTGAAVLSILLITGVILSIAHSDWILLGLFAGSCAVLAMLILLRTADERKTAALDDRKFIHWDAAIPEIQRQNVTLEVRELARLLGVGDENIADLLSTYIVAEDLALRQIQQEENQPLMRHVSIAKTPFDAILVHEDMVTCIEVSFLVVPDIRQERIESMLKKITMAKSRLAEMKSRLRLRLMLVLVTQLSVEEEEQLRGMLISRRFSDTPVDVDIRLLDFEMLQNVYVSE